MKKNRILIPLLALSLAVSCGEKPESGEDGGGTVPAGNVEVKISPDRTSVLKNPLTGWAMYVSGTADPSYLDTEFYVSSLGKNVRVADYSTCIYVRTNWRNFNPEEGVYFWNDPSSKLYQIYTRAQELGLPMAFRVVVDGRDQGANTPQWVYEKGAEFWLENNKYPDRKVPNVLDPIWRKCYEKFIEDFAKEFNDPSKIAFIDAYGLGKWGEGHNVCYEGIEPISYNSDGSVKEYAGIVSENTVAYKEDTMEWITSLYSRCFTNVPLVINYHRQIGHPRSSGKNAQPDSEHLLQIAIDNGYCLRADSFGMHNQDWGYNDWERNYVKQWNNKLPIILEGGYVWSNSGHKNSIAAEGYETAGDVREGEFLEGELACVNMMDFRVGDEVRSWFEEAFPYVERFIQEGGYRLYPDKASVPQTVEMGADVSVTSRWVNLGWGFCPTNLKQWNQKYKVAYALLDMETEEPVYEFVDESTDLSTWLKGSPTSYSFDISMKTVAIGGYIWAVGIVDTTKEKADGTHEIGLKVAANKKSLTDEGWVKLTNVTVN